MNENNEVACTVQGTIYEPQGAVAADVQVRIYNQQLRTATLLGEAKTNNQGQYMIRYTAVAQQKTTDEVRAGGPAKEAASSVWAGGRIKASGPLKAVATAKVQQGFADLSAAVYGNDGAVLYQSTADTILYNAPRAATLDIYLNTASQPQPVEFATIGSALKPLIGDVPVDQLVENDQHRDITFLSREAAIDFTWLSYFVLAYKVQKQFQLPPEFVYGLLRQGALQNPNATSPLSLRTTISVDSDITGLTYDLVLLPVDTIQTDITAATQQHVIGDLSKEMPSILAELTKLQPDAQKYVQQERPQQLLNLVTGALNSGSYKNLAAALGKNYYGDIPGLLNAIAESNPFGGAQSGGTTQPGDTTQPGGGTQPQSGGTPDLTGLMQGEMHKAFLSSFENDSDHLFSAHKEPIMDALKNTPDLHLGKGSIDAQLKHRSIPEETRRELRKLQRLYKLVPHYEKAKALHQDGLHSAFHIVSMGRKQFVKKYTQNNTFTETQAQTIYNKAGVAHTAAFELAGQLRDYATVGQWKMLGGAEVAKNIQAVNKDFPNFQSLFQGIDYCDCQDCRNVYSPAAYLVDVLQFLNNRLVMGGTKTARDILFSRRPELGDLDLNCNNAYTELPYIDLVCEILEQAVSPDPGLDLDNSYTADLVPGAIDAHLLTALQTAGLSVTSTAIIYPSYVEGAVTVFIVRDALITLKIAQTGTGWNARELHQTHLSQDELLACPEYVNNTAYTLLQTAHSSFALPFDLYQQEGESLLETVSIKRADLMSAFQVPAGLTGTSIAAVALGIPPADATLIVTPDLANQYVYWNTTAALLLTTVNEVDVFLAKSMLAYTDLQNLLAQSFVNPANKIYIQHEDSTCNPAQKLLIDLDLPALDRMHRFIRLWKKAGLSMTDLNRIITYPQLGNGTLDGNILVFLYGLQTLQNTLGISPDQALSFYGLIPDDSTTALYQSTFLSAARSNPIDSAFTVIDILANEALPAGSQDTLANHLQALCRCLRRKPADITTIIQQLSTLSGVAQPALTRANLAFVYSNSLLASSLGIALQDMYTLSGLSGQALFNSPVAGQYFFSNPDATNAYIRTVQFVQNSGFTVSDLSWFLTSQDPTGLRTISDDKITAFLQSLQKSCQDAFTATASPFQPGAAPQENLNGLKQILGMLPGIAANSLNDVVSVVNNTYAVAAPTAQQLMSDIFNTWFTPAVITALQTDVTTVQGAVGPAIAVAQNALIADLCSNASLYRYTAAKNAALLAAAQTTFGASDVVTQTILNNAALKFPVVLNPPLLGALLTDDALVDKVNTPPVPPVITPAAFDSQYRAVRLLNMIVALYNKTNPSAADWQWFLQNNTTMGWMPLDTLCYQPGVTAVTYAAWLSFAQALQLITQFPPVTNPADPTTSLEWTDVWDQVIDLSGLPALETTLVRFTGWDPVDTPALITYFADTYPASVPGISASSFAQPATYLQLNQTTAFLRLLGMPLGDLTQIIQPALTAPEAALIQQALRNKYSEAQWLNVIQPVMDALRPQKRDALVNYLLAVNPTLTDTDDLYDYFLVDVEMQPGTPTSRIVLAHSTVQLFIQRCLMGLEPQATADITDDDGWSQWDWMSEYQVWVANRKIFVYPENWYSPELRLNMSPFFSDLINDLQQNQVTDDNVEAAAINYLDDLDNVANLDVRTCYYDVNSFTFHVFARVRGGSSYYYRTCLNETQWSAWTEVKVDISGDCLLTFVRNNRLFLAWPLFTEDTQQQSTQVVPGTGDNAPTAPQKRYLVQLAVSELIDGTWQPKRVSHDSLTTSSYFDGDLLPPEQDTLRMINFDLGTAGDDIVCTFGDSSIGGPYTLGTFSLAGCKGYPEVVNWIASIPEYEIIPQFVYTDFREMQYQQEANPPATGLIARTIFSPFSYKTILGRSPSTYEVVYPHEFSLLDYIYILLELLLPGGLNAGTRDSLAGNKRFVIPMASFMPWFYEDKDRDYVIFPGFFSQDAANGQNTTYTFSGIYQFVTNVIALVKKYIQLYLSDPTHNLGNLITQLINDPTYQALLKQWQFFSSTQPQLLFMNFYHPLICQIKSSVYLNGLPSIMSYAFQSQQTSFNFNNTYTPDVPTVATPYPVENIDFSAAGSYSLYNWELFYDLPFYVGNQLSQNQQFDDAEKWYNYIFNPTGGQGGTSPQKYWITKPFHEFTAANYVDQRIDTILTDLAQDPSGVSITNLANAVANWRSQPFQPDVVASTRQVAYQKAIFIAYINNLIAWGDSLLTQNTTETRAQATQRYILADELMGPKPQGIPPAVPVPDETYNQMVAKVDLFGNALIDLENLVPNLNVLPQKGAELPPSTSFSLLYFCIPPNDTMATLWSTIADRLYKLRNSEDINGNYTSVSLFAPPIDPGMLVRAVASGLSISSIIANLNAPPPIYRFRVMSAKATELAQDVSDLGKALLDALEKKDAEMLSQLRSNQEVALQGQILLIRQNQVLQADQMIQELNAAKAIAQDKFNYYSSRPFMNGWEVTQAVLTGLGVISQTIGTVLDATSGAAHLAPTVDGGGAGIGGTPLVTIIYGGVNIGNSTSKFGTMFKNIADILQTSSGLIGNIGAYQRRQDDWNFQTGQATLEMTDYDQKIAVANISKTIATQESTVQQKRIDQATAMLTAIQTKYTNEALYSWMISQISAVYYQAYQLAYSIAKQAEQCYNYELATESTFIQFGYWNTTYRGLLAGDQLLAAIKKMEGSYLDTNRREYELTKNVSIASLNPRALLQLINTGSCDFSIPELLFDMDYPGQYLRRLKTVAVTIPCITGPLTTVACTLTMVSNQYRNSALPSGGGPDPYAENPVGGDSRFVYNSGFIQAIALSSAQNDDGLFQLNFDDDRYLPFEGTGAISSWHLEMNDPSAFAQFDYQSITDVILQLKYTAREGGSSLRSLASNSLKGVLKTIADQVPPVGLFRAFDLKHDFPNSWYAFITDGSGTYKLTLTKANFPFYTQNALLKLSVESAALLVETSSGSLLQVSISGGTVTALMKNAPLYGNEIQFIDPSTDFTPVLKLTTDTADFSAAVSNFATVSATITGAWLILNYDLG